MVSENTLLTIFLKTGKFNDICVGQEFNEGEFLDYDLSYDDKGKSGSFWIYKFGSFQVTLFKGEIFQIGYYSSCILLKSLMTESIFENSYIEEKACYRMPSGVEVYLDIENDSCKALIGW